MTELFQVLESEGFVEDQDAFKVYELDAKRVEHIYRRVHETVWKAQYDNPQDESGNDPFSFVASASMRGDSTCWEPRCRLAKLDFLNAYSALYANRVSVPLLLSEPNDLGEVGEYATKVLSLSLLTLLRSRPLIEAGIVHPTIMRTQHCAHELERLTDFMEAADDYAHQLAKDHLDEFEAIYQVPEKSPSGLSTIYLSGPTDFLEHDMVQLFDESPAWRLKSWRFDQEGKVSLKGRRKLRSIERIFETISENTTFYLSYALDHKARFLSDLPGEVLLLEDSGDQSEPDRSSRLATSTSAFRHLSHSLPLLAGLSIAEIIRIRNEDRDSFAAYQFEVAAITQEALNNGLGEAAAQELFRSKLLPKITQLKKELRSEQGKIAKYLGFGAVGIAASVAIGAYGLPLLGTIPIATVATGLLAKGAQRAIELKPEAKQRNDLYFLVRLLQEAS